MYALFHKKKFVNFWLNDPSDSGWIQRTAKALGLDESELDVMWYEHARTNQDIISFDENLNMQIHEKRLEKKLIKEQGKSDVEQDVEVIAVKKNVVGNKHT